MLLTRLLTNTTPLASIYPAWDDGVASFGVDVLVNDTLGICITANPTKYIDYGGPNPLFSGAVYVTNWSDGSLVQEITPPDVQDQVDGANFGWRIAQTLIGSTHWLIITCLGVGAVVGSVHFYEWTGAAYTYRQRINGNGALAANTFGSSCAADGSLCVVGDKSADITAGNAGALHVFREAAGVWAEDIPAKTQAPAAVANQYFGHAAAVSGTAIAVSANRFFDAHANEGRVYIYTDAGLGNPLTLASTLTPPVTVPLSYYFGDSLDLSGDYCAIGWPLYTTVGAPVTYGGAIAIFKQSGGVWSENQVLETPTDSDGNNAYLGDGSHSNANRGVCLSGSYLVGGALGWWTAPNPGGAPGAAFLWERDATTGLYAAVVVDGSSGYQIYPGAGSAYFGAAVAVAAGPLIAIGAPTEWGDWATNNALPEGPPPAWTYGGTVRQYTSPVSIMRAPMPGLYVDDVRYSDPVDYYAIYNMVPDDTENDVAIDSPVSLVIGSVAAGALGDVIVRILRTASGLLETVYTTGGGFDVAYPGTATVRQSPGSAVNDELVVSFTPVVPFASEDTIVIFIDGEVLASGLFSTSYSFTVEDITAPELESILWTNPRRALVKFNEPMLEGSEPGGTAYVFSTRGNVSVHSATEVEIRDADLSNDMVGYWACIDGSVHTNNNGYRPILSVDTATQRLTLDTTAAHGGPMTADDGRDIDPLGNLARERQLGLTVSPWCFTARLTEEGAAEDATSPERIQCTFLPRIVEAEEVLTTEVPAGADTTQYIWLRLFEDISIDRLYTLRADMVQDANGNAASASTLNFQAPTFNSPTYRAKFWLRGMLSASDMEQDIENDGQLRKVSVVLQDSANIVWNRIDQLQYLEDPFLCPEEAIPFLLFDLGNPFKFYLPTLAWKRKLAFCLPGLYSKVGTPEGIEAFLKCFLGYGFVLTEFLHADLWVIGDPVLGRLGLTTVLGPSTDYAKNSYEILSPVDLTAWERAVVIEVAMWADPIDKHLIRIIEPSTSSPSGTSTVSTYWVLGTSVLGISTKLGG